MGQNTDEKEALRRRYPGLSDSALLAIRLSKIKSVLRTMDANGIQVNNETFRFVYQFGARDYLRKWEIPKSKYEPSKLEKRRREKFNKKQELFNKYNVHTPFLAKYSVRTLNATLKLLSEFNITPTEYSFKIAMRNGREGLLKVQAAKKKREEQERARKMRGRRF